MILNFLKKKIRNLSISMDLNNSSLRYEYYYFNGIPIPENIKVEKKGKKLYISWDIADSKIKDINETNDIYYYVYIKNKNNIFNLGNRTQEKYYYYDYLLEDNEYEIKVRSEIGFHCSDWSEVIKIKTGKKDKNEINIGLSKIFGNNISNNKETKTIFSPSTTNPFRGLFDNNNNNKNQTSSLFENNITQKTSLFGNSSINQEKQENSLFANTNNPFSSILNENKTSDLFFSNSYKNEGELKLGNINVKGGSLKLNDNKEEFLNENEQKEK